MTNEKSIITNGEVPWISSGGDGWGIGGITNGEDQFYIDAGGDGGNITNGEDQFCIDAGGHPIYFDAGGFGI